MSQNFDVVVIGGGPAGYVGAIRFAQLGYNTAIVDRVEWEGLGGVCLNVGCIPSKSLLVNAELAHTLRERGKEFGFSFDNLQLDFGAAVKRSRQVSSRLVKGVNFLMNKNKITQVIGQATLKAPGQIEVTTNDGKSETLTAQHIVVATGAHPIAPAAFNVDNKRVVTYIEAILQEERPQRVLIVGAGAIGCEFGTVWNGYGSEVTIVELLPSLLPATDPEIGKEVEKAFKKKGINVLTGHKVEQVDASDPNVVKVTVSKDGQPQVIEVDQVLVAIGFRPNTKGIGLEAVGVQLTEAGFIAVDDHMRTNIPGIYAIGDVTGKKMFAHVASAMGILVAEAVAHADGKLHEAPQPLNFDMMPFAIYCKPEAAGFGYTEEQAKAKGYELKVARFNFQANGRALGEGDYAGWVKIITDAKYGEILGAHMVGPHVTELLPELTLAQNMELTGEEIARNVHAHPSLSEVLMEAAHGLTEGGYIHA